MAPIRLGLKELNYYFDSSVLASAGPAKRLKEKVNGCVVGGKTYSIGK